MADLKNISIMILSKDRQFSESLKFYLKQQELSERFSIGSYEDVDKCLENLNYDDKDDVIVLDYDEQLAEELHQKYDELLRDFTLIHRVPTDMDREKVRYIKGGIKEYAVVGKKPFKRITSLVERITRRNKVAKNFASINYWIMGIALLFAIFVMIYFFVL